MRKLFIFSLFIIAWPSFAQIVEKTYSKITWSSNDTIRTSWSKNINDFVLTQISKSASRNINYDAQPGVYATIYYDSDSIRVSYSNKMPFGEYHYFPFESRKGKTLLRIGFESVTSFFPASYIKKNVGNVQIDIPEVYELANIIWTISPSGTRATDLNKEGRYYEKVLNYFKPYLSHPIFKKLNFSDSLYFNKYYDFRENSFCFNFKGDKLVYNGPYYYVTGGDWDNYNSLFKELLLLVEDFAQKSNYRAFYKSNLKFYREQMQRQKEMLPLKRMWNWLEEHFQRKYDSYRVVFSPLILSSHSTQNFTTFTEETPFKETVMFICGPDRYDFRKDINEKQKEGLMSGIVFTEIDHNYVNPATNKYSKLIDSIFIKRNVWTGENTNWYSNPVSVFNEYMTHAVFCLWVLDNYEKAIADFIINNRESLMVDKRGFIKFKEFNRALIALREKNKDDKVVELYPIILDWCKTQIDL